MRMTTETEIGYRNLLFGRLESSFNRSLNVYSICMSLENTLIEWRSRFISPVSRPR